MRGLGALLVATSTSACLEPPVPKADPPAGDLPRVTLDQGSELAVTTPAYLLVFEADGWLMPRSLEVGGMQMLTFDHPYDEDGMGVSMYPDRQINSEASPTGGMEGAVRTVLASGPAQVAIEVLWTSQSPCNPSADALLRDNASRFTFYPDGRIVRYDELHFDAPQSCGAHILGSTNGLRFDRAPLLSVVTDGQPVQTFSYDPDLSGVELTDAMSSGWACIEGNNRTIGATFRQPEAGDFEFFEVSRFGGEAIGLSYYFTEYGAPVAGTTYTASTALEIRADGTTCASLGAGSLAVFQTERPIQGAIFDSRSGAYRVSATETITAVETVLAGFALDLPVETGELGVSRSSPEAGRTRELVDGVDYLSQTRASGEGTVATLWMADELRATESLTFSGRR